MEREGKKRDAARRQAGVVDARSPFAPRADGSVDFLATGGAMFRLVAMCCAIAAFTFGALPPAAAVVGETTTYDTVDGIEVLANQIKVTGIISGQGALSTTLYTILGSAASPVNGGTTDVAASRCDRLALLVASKPGKFQFAVVEVLSARFSCKLIVRTP